MLVSDSKKFIFVHISKTAGTSIRSMLVTHANPRPGKLYSLLRYFDLPKNYRKYRFGYHDYLDVAERKLPEEIYRNYMKIAFVRNPWDRLVSAYAGFYTQHTGERKKQKMSFMEFLHRQKARKNYQVRRIINQYGNIDLDFMGRFENLEQDCKRLAQLLDVEFDLPYRNKSQGRKVDYRDHYDHESYNFVCDNWTKDIELLNYEF